MIDRSGGVLNSLNFSTPGVNMRFGIGHNTETGNTKKNAETNIGPSSSSSKLSKSYKSRGGSQIHDATKDTELMPNRLASKQAFEMNNCAMLL